MITKKVQTGIKNQKFECMICDFNTCKLSKYERHLLTKKHKKKVQNAKKGPKKTAFVEFKCDFCNKIYKHRSGLSRHQKKCEKITKKTVETEALEGNSYHFEGNKKRSKKKEEEKLDEELDEKDAIIKKLKKDVEIAKLEKEAVIANYENELLKKDCKYKDDIIDMYKNNKGDVYKNNTFNTNNSISINLFLNKNCKNAMNLTDFVDQIKVQLEDVLYQKDHGSTEGLTNILTKQLQDMNPIDRPIHCSDEKNLQFYIKEDDKWSKNSADDDMEKSLRKLQVKQVEVMKEWEDNHPSFATSEELLEERNKLMAQILHGCDDKIAMRKNVKDVKKNVAKLLSIQEVMDNMDK